MPPKTKKSKKGLFTISVLGTHYSFTQKEGEKLDEFKLRLQKEFDDKDINIQIT
jgi:transcriptional regulator